MKTSSSYWKKRLSQTLTRTVPAPDNAPFSGPVGPGKSGADLRLAIVGIGNELNGDDAAGVQAVRALRRFLSQQSARPDLLLVEAGPAPENFTGPLRRFAPDMVLIIDAADMGEPPGTLDWIEMDEAEGLSASTHSLPPTVFASFLMSELGCQVAMLGIQARQVEFAAGMSPEVENAVEELVNYLQALLSE